MDAIVSQADLRSKTRLLDLGTGTGNLAAKLTGDGRCIWGVDFSKKMLAIARRKVPSVRFYECDILEEWPSDLERRYDCIVSAYVLHHFPLDAKVSLIVKLVKKYLVKGGCIIIGDVSFPTIISRSDAKNSWKSEWDEDEYYWAADESIQKLTEQQLHTKYVQISFCGGVYAITAIE